MVLIRGMAAFRLAGVYHSDERDGPESTGQRVDLHDSGNAVRASKPSKPAVDMVESRPRRSSLSRDRPPPVHGRCVMRVMVIVKANAESEAGVMPDTEALAAMGKFNEQLVEAGVMLMGEGLHPSSKGVRVRFAGKQRDVIDGPFADTKELIAGFWLWQVRSLSEAIEWLKRAPFDGSAEIELRQVVEMPDFGAAATPEIRAREARLREKIAGR